MGAAGGLGEDTTGVDGMADGMAVDGGIMGEAGVDMAVVAAMAAVAIGEHTRENR